MHRRDWTEYNKYAIVYRCSLKFPSILWERFRTQDFYFGAESVSTKIVEENMSTEEPLTSDDLKPRETQRLAQYSPLVPYDDLISSLEERLGSESPLIVVLDFSERLWPYRNDQHSLVQAMQSAWPERDMSFRIFGRGPQGGWTDWVEAQQRDSIPEVRNWEASISADTKILIVGDMGRLSMDLRIVDAWRNLLNGFLGERVRRLDESFESYKSRPKWDVTVLTPLGCVPGFKNVIPWIETRETSVSCFGLWPGLEDLLGMAAVLRRIDPPLLRAMRQLLPVNGARDSGLEAVFWSCAHVDAGFAANLRLGPIRELHLNRFRALPEDTQLELFHLFKCHHAHLPAALYWEEVLLFSAHAREEVLADSVVAGEIANATLWLDRLFATLEGEAEINRSCKAIADAIVSRADEKMKLKYPILSL